MTAHDVFGWVFIACGWSLLLVDFVERRSWPTGRTASVMVRVGWFLVGAMAAGAVGWLVTL